MHIKNLFCSTRSTLGLLLVLSSACSDSPTAAPRVSSDSAARAGTAANRALTARVIGDLEHRTSGRNRVVESVTVATSDGRKETLDLTTLAGRLRGSLQSGAAPLIADDSDPLQITGASYVYFPDDHTMRSGATTISNKTGLTSYTHNSTVMLSTGSGLLLRTDKYSETKSVYGGIFTSTWPDITLTGGCAWNGAETTDHLAKYPGGTIGAPQIITNRATAASASQASLIVASCRPTRVDTVKAPDSPPCEDMSTCTAPGGGGGPPGGQPLPHEITISSGGALTPKTVTVCYVTDWFVNGAWVETVVDFCRQETR